MTEYTTQHFIDDVKALALARLNDPYLVAEMQRVPVTFECKYSSTEDAIAFIMGDVLFASTDSNNHGKDWTISVYAPPVARFKKTQYDIAVTTVHELGHALNNIMSQRDGKAMPKGHGEDWVAACAMLGLHIRPYLGEDHPGDAARPPLDPSEQWEPDMLAAIRALPNCTDLAGIEYQIRHDLGISEWQ